MAHLTTPATTPSLISMAVTTAGLHRNRALIHKLTRLRHVGAAYPNNDLILTAVRAHGESIADVCGRFLRALSTAGVHALSQLQLMQATAGISLTPRRQGTTYSFHRREDQGRLQYHATGTMGSTQPPVHVQPAPATRSCATCARQHQCSPDRAIG